MLFMTSYLVTNSHQTLPKCVKGISEQQLKTAGADKNPPEGIKRKHLVKVVTPPPTTTTATVSFICMTTNSYSIAKAYNSTERNNNVIRR